MPGQDIFWREGAGKRDRQILRILLVEDNPFQQLCTAHVLKQLGHAVTVTGDGFGALAALHRDKTYDVILMDCELPMMDGLKATRFIREAEGGKDTHIAIIGISARASPEDCFKAGMDDFLRKPLHKLLLKAVLARWIREKTGRRFARIPNEGLLAAILFVAVAAFIGCQSPVSAKSINLPFFAKLDAQTATGGPATSI